MTELWYQNPKVLLDNYDQFFPNKSLDRNQKINALARFAIYYSALIIIFNTDSKWLSVSAIILVVSYFLGRSENFTSEDRELDPENCQPPTKDNPFMNYTVGDLIESPNRLPACDYEKVKDEMRKQFRSHLYSDSSDIWGKFISDRNFYTMPNTEIVNDQTGFAQWCFGNSGQCKSEGKNCLKQRDPVYHRGRITTIDDDVVY
jgi:hypothetical protein